MTSTVSWAAPGSVTYQYDEGGRLKATTYDAGQNRTYGLDAAGNRKSTSATPGNGALVLSVASSVSEGANSLTVSVTRIGSSSGAITVQYATSNGTATAGIDYSATSGTLSWASGDAATKTFNVPITNDTAYEGNETFIVTLSAPTGGAVLGSPSQASVTITDDDAAPSFAISPVTQTVSEAVGTVSYTVTKTGSTAFSHSVSYATANGTAIAGSDYTSTSGTLTFAPGDTSKTVTVPIINDSATESNETFTVTLSAPTNSATITTAQSTTTIADYSVTETATMTVGMSTPDEFGITPYGYYSGYRGSLSPATLSSGSNYVLSYLRFEDISFTGGGPPVDGCVSISGFPTDPGAGWLISATAAGVLRSGASASYSYASGTASWYWSSSGFGIPTSGTVIVSVTHH